MTQTPLWSPSADTVSQSNITRFCDRLGLNSYEELYDWSTTNHEAFWQAFWDFSGIIAQTKGDIVIENKQDMERAKFFPNAKLNFAENLLRRRDDSKAIVFWGEDQVKRTLTYSQLYQEVAAMAAALRAHGITVGDRIAAIIPNTPEAIIAMLAAASIGAIWSSCSPDFGVQGILDRFQQIEPKIIFCADGYFYKSKTHSCMDKLSQVTQALPSLEKIIVFNYAGGSDIPQNAIAWDDFTAGFENSDLAFEQLPFNHPLYIMFSSGTTGIPKCIVHGAGGTLLQHLKEHRLHCDVKPDDRLFYFTTCGWMMWQWLVSGLASEATLLLFDGNPFYPDGNRLFDYADAEGMTHFGTSAKYIDALNKAGIKPKQTHKLTNLRMMLSTGSPLVPESFDYVYRDIKEDICLASISGGTDIIGCFALGNPVAPVWRGELQTRGLGLNVEVWDDDGNAVQGQKGELVCTAPFPSQPLGFWNDPDGQKYHDAYYGVYDNVWHHGDFVELTDHHGLVFYGRSDAILNPGGVRIGTAEIYRQVEQIEDVLESIVVGQDWDGDVRVVLFVKLREDLALSEDLQKHIVMKVRSNASPRHVPSKIIQVNDIPRTISGKIVELAVREVIHNRPVKNVEALANPEALDYFRDIPELKTG
ncbi:MAG: acetoacetate--CoA ligase [Alphaproteobacteria bacterium]